MSCQGPLQGQHHPIQLPQSLHALTRFHAASPATLLQFGMPPDTDWAEDAAVYELEVRVRPVLEACRGGCKLPGGRTNRGRRAVSLHREQCE